MTPTKSAFSGSREVLPPGTCNLSVHILREEHHAIGRAAWAQGQTITGWIRSVVMSALPRDEQERLVKLREERRLMLKIADAGRRSRARSRMTSAGECALACEPGPTGNA